jgi:hypothetical protein
MEKTTASYFNYLNQTQMVGISLREGKIHPMLVFSEKYKLSAIEFKKLSEVFVRNYPKDFVEPGSGTLSIGGQVDGGSEFYEKWTYGSIGRDNKVTLHVQLIVFFEVDTTSEETLKDPKISRIEVKEGVAIGKLDPKEVLKRYKEAREANKKYSDLPPPPLSNDN